MGADEEDADVAESAGDGARSGTFPAAAAASARAAIGRPFAALTLAGILNEDLEELDGADAEVGGTVLPADGVGSTVDPGGAPLMAAAGSRVC